MDPTQPTGAEAQPTPEPPELLPATFNDLAGDEWRLELSFAGLARIKARTGLDFGDLKQIGRAWSLTLFDDLLAIEAVWIALGGSDGADDAAVAMVKGESVTKLDFLENVDGVVLNAAREALREAIENFTPPLKRTILQEGLGAVNETFRQLLTEAAAEVRAATQPAIAKAMSLYRSGKLAPSGREYSATSTTTGRRERRRRR